MATIRVESVEAGLRYTTEDARLAYSGAFCRALEGLAFDITAFTELRATEGALRATGEFELAMPLPSWWPIPDRAMAAGERLVQSIVDKDTRLTVARLKGEMGMVEED